MIRREFLPGWGAMTALAIASLFLSQLIEVGGKHPLEAPVIAIVAGMMLRNLGLVPSRCMAGVKSFEKILILGIVLIGGSLNFNLFFEQGVDILLIILGTMLLGLGSVILFARLFSLSQTLSVLLAVGTTICGGTAIAVTAPLIKAKEEETSYAIGTIALWGLVAILLYPFLAQQIGVSDTTFGIFAGTSIHSTPQVVGAGFIFSDEAGKIATAVKLVRNCFLAPMALLVALWFARVSMARGGEQTTDWAAVARAFPWFLFAYFIMAGMNSAGYFTPEGVKAFSKSGKFLVLIGMAGIGLNTTFSSFRGIGMKPFFVGLIGSLIVAGASSACILLFL